MELQDILTYTFGILLLAMPLLAVYHCLPG